jgi:hypothetical protein
VAVLEIRSGACIGQYSHRDSGAVFAVDSLVAVLEIRFSARTGDHICCASRDGRSARASCGSSAGFALSAGRCIANARAATRAARRTAYYARYSVVSLVTRTMLAV